MLSFKTRLTTGLITAALLAGTFAPATAFAKTKITVKDNGAGSTNNVTVNNKSKVKVRQTNRTAVVNLVGVIQNTGGNSANNNTGGGDVTAESGNATSNVTNNTTTGGNAGVVDPCGCDFGNTTVKLNDNGAGSDNSAEVVNKSKVKVTQSNSTLVINGVLVVQNTGDNHANGNTGDGDIDANSGNAGSDVTNNVTTGGNTLNPAP